MIAQTAPDLKTAANLGLIAADTILCSDSIIVRNEALMHTPVSPFIVAPEGMITDQSITYNEILTDMSSAYFDCKNQAGTSISNTPNPNQTFNSGVYKVTGNFHIKYPIFLSGSNTDIFIFNISDSIIIDTSVSINLMGVNPQNIYFTCGKSLKVLTDLAVQGIYLVNENIAVQSYCLGRKAFLCNGKAFFNGKADLYSYNSIAETIFSNIFTFSGCGSIKYSQVTQQLNKRYNLGGGTGPTLPQTLNVITPVGAAIVKAFVWFAVEGLDANGNSPSNRIFTINSNNVTAHRIGFDGSGTCWGAASPFNNRGTSAYFCDVTSLVTSGNTNYTINGLPQYGINGENYFDTDGLTIFVVYGDCNVSGMATYIEIQHGLMVESTLNANYVTLNIAAPPIALTLQDAFMLIGDLEANINLAYGLAVIANATNFPITLTNPQFWNFISVPISIPVANPTVTFRVHKSGNDCINMPMAGVRYEYSRPVCSTLTASIVSTNTCQGASVGTATANAGCGQSPFTYLWSNGQITQTATGLAPGTYTVTVTDGLPATTSAFVVINSFSTVQVTTLDFSKCVSTDAFSVSDGFIQVKANNGISPYNYLWSNSMTTATVTGLHAGIYTVTVTDSRGCTGTRSITLYGCCTMDPGHVFLYPFNGGDHFISTDIINNPAFAPFVNTSVSPPTFTSMYTNYFSSTGPQAYFVINGTLFIDVDVDFSDLELVLGPNAEIRIINNSTLRCLNHNYLHGCGEAMWNGIVIENSGSSFISNSSAIAALPETYIEDAKNAITSENEGYYDLYNVDFNKNWKGIVVNDQTFVKFPGVVVNSRFECYTITSASRIPATLLPPHSGRIPDSGIELNDVVDIDIGDGSTTGLTNTFDRLSFGIRAFGGGATINNNIFKNITFYGVFGDGQYALPYRELKVGTSSGLDFNTFLDSRGGIQFLRGMNVLIKNNVFQNMRLFGSTGPTNACIRGNDLTPANHISIYYNTMNNFDNGIYVNDFTRVHINILGNVIYNSLTSPYGRNGIYFGNPMSGRPTVTLYKIEGNTISNNRHNIHLMNTSDAFIDNMNTLYYDFIPGQTPAVTYYGAKIENSTNITVQENSIINTGPEPTSAFDNSLFGLFFGKADGNYALCNTLTKMGTAIRFNSTGINTVNFNQMNFHRLGVVMNNSTIGDQGTPSVAQDNQWVHNTISPLYDLKAIGTTPIGSETWYFQLTGSLPFEPSSIFDMYPSFFILKGSGSPNPLCQAPLRDDEQDRMAAIARADGDYALLPEEEIYNIQESVYIQLDQDSTWMNLGTSNDAALQTFYNDASNSTMGLLNQARKDLINGNNQQAGSIISTITPENLSEENDIIVKNIYLVTFAVGKQDLDSIQYTALYNVAIQDPVSGGRSVYTARYMINLDVDDLASESNGERLINSHTFSTQPYHKPILFPIPAIDKINIDIRLLDKETGIIYIYDTFGKIVFKSSLKEQQNKIEINVDKFSNGLYLIQFETNKGIRLSEKFLKTK